MAQEEMKKPRFELVAEEAGWWKILSHGRWICGFHEDNADDASVSEVGELVSLANEAEELKEFLKDLLKSPGGIHPTHVLQVSGRVYGDEK